MHIQTGDVVGFLCNSLEYKDGIFEGVYIRSRVGVGQGWRGSG